MCKANARRTSLALVLSSLLGAASTGAAQADEVETGLVANDLGTLGGQRATAQAINGAGLIVGTDVEATAGRRPARAFVVPFGGAMTNLDEWASADDVNDSGVVVGASFSATRSRAFVWSEAGGFVELPPFEDARRDSAVAVDREGKVIVNSASTGETSRVVVWHPTTETYTALPTRDGRDVYATAASPSGTIVGYLTQFVDRGPDEARLVIDHPVLWDATTGQLHELPVYRDASGTAWSGEASDVNDAGTIVGTFARDGQTRAVAWMGPEHVLHDLGPGKANAVNMHDIVAGAVPHPRPDDSPFARFLPQLWNLRNGARIPLRGFIAAPSDIVTGEATDINGFNIPVGSITTSANDLASHAVQFDRYAAPGIL